MLALAPDSPIWVGGHEIPSAERGVVARGVPLGTQEFVEAHLSEPSWPRT